ncbi:hypothetical protein DYE50_06430 [Treponema ruminis]|uniref:Uncharacterized protein n=2 Tax=Treponema ruminis TaxID=744515 RepID=A0A7W8LMR0_9SPIR|nr:hypothetical protein [Treponema ruminis]MBB5226563.1 hypothetical protein [Treponema ruminis]QSI02207.1 hypothetical protein DYE50_06430 [Treponema ruminis]
MERNFKKSANEMYQEYIKNNEWAIKGINTRKICAEDIAYIKYSESVGSSIRIMKGLSSTINERKTFFIQMEDVLDIN